MTRLVARLIALFHRRRLDAELGDELFAHLDFATAENLAQGMSAEDARRAATVKFGGALQTAEAYRDQRGFPLLDSLAQDVRYALRGMRRSPSFTAISVITLGIGIGVNAAVFTVTNAVFKGFPLVHRNDRLLYIASRGAGVGPFVSYPDFEDWRTQARSFEGLAAVNAVRINLSDRSGIAESRNATQVSVNTFGLLGQSPLLGRDFAPADETSGAAPVVMLSYDFWERRYAKDPAIVGHTIRINGTPTTVIGVMAEGFAFPRRQDLWMPLAPTPDLQKREARGLWFVVGRMANGVTMTSAQADLDTIGRRLASAYPRTNQGVAPFARGFNDFFIGSSATRMYASFLAAVGLVLLIACANLASLLLARGIARSREISVRIALGAGRRRIMRQLFVESVTLSACGGAVGWLIARWSVRAYELAAGAPGWFERALHYEMDIRVFAYLLAISIGTGLLFGLAPALRLSKLDVNSALKDGGHGATRGPGGKRLSTLLVAGQIALALVLLAGAGVLIRSFLNIYMADPGVRTANVLTSFLELPDARYHGTETQIAFFDRLKARLDTIPGVESTAIADRFPTQGARRLPYEVSDALSVDGRPRETVSALTVGPGYFRTLGAVVLSGREFTDADGRSEGPIAIVNQRLASQQWPGENPLGKRLRLVGGPNPDAWLTVVGVVSNIVQSDTTRQEFDPLVYVPYRQAPTAGMWVFVRTRVPPAGLASSLRGAVQTTDSDLAVFDVLTLTERLADNYRNSESYGSVFLIFAAIALLLAAVGIYALVAYAVSERTQEIGVRMAMGASARDILALVLRQGTPPVGMGVALGLAASLAVTPFLEPVLVQVSPADPIAFVVAAVILIVAAILGCLIPARRAVRVDPVVALRHD